MNATNKQLCLRMVTLLVLAGVLLPNELVSALDAGCITEAKISFRGSSLAFATPTSSTFAPTSNVSLLPAIYVFRRDRNLWSAAVHDQRDILEATSAGDMRRFIIVVVPDGVAPNISTLGALALSNYELVPTTTFVCHCPLMTNSSVFTSASERDFGSVQPAYWANGTATHYMRFSDTGVLTTASASPLFELLDPTTNALRYVVCDGMPGDDASLYTGVRQVFTVSTSLNLTSVAEIKSSGLVISETSAIVHFALLPLDVLEALSTATITGALALSNTSGANATGSVVGQQVPITGFLLPLTRLATRTLKSTMRAPAQTQMHIASNAILFIEGQVFPVIDTMPGNASYSDVRAVYKLPAVPVNVTSFADAVAVVGNESISLNRYFTGTFVNCPIFPTAASSPASSFGGQRLNLWFNGVLVHGWLEGEELVNGCAVQAFPVVGLFTPQRTNESSVLEAARLFTARPRELDALTYTPFVADALIDVPSAYPSTGGTVAASSLIPSTAWSTNMTTSIADDTTVVPNSRLFNAPRWSNNDTPHSAASLAAQDVLGNMHTAISERSSAVTVEWRFATNATTMDVNSTLWNVSASLHSPVVLGVGGTEPYGGVFLFLYIDARGTQCTRQLQGSLLRPRQLTDVSTANPMQLSATSMPTLERSLLDGGTVRIRTGLWNTSKMPASWFSVAGRFFTFGALDSDRFPRSTLDNCSVPIVSTMFPNSLVVNESVPSGDYLSCAVSVAMNWSDVGGGVGQSNTTAVEGQMAARTPALAALGLGPNTMPAPIRPSVSSTQAMLVSLPTTTASQGSFRCDSSFSIAWRVLNASSEVEFILSPSASVRSARMWFSLGLGSSAVSGSDLAVVYVHPTNASRLVVEDKKCITASGAVRCLRDAEQNVVSVGVINSTWVFRRPVISPDRRSSVSVDASLQTLIARTLTTSSAYGGSARLVSYVAFSNSPAFALQDDAVGYAVLYRLRSASTIGQTSSSPLGAQDGLPSSLRYFLSDVAPGTLGYSDLRILVDVFVPTSFVGQAPQQVSDVPSHWVRTATTTTVNCPMVHASSVLDSVVSTVASMWPVTYRGVAYRCAAFSSRPGDADPNRTQRLFLIRSPSNATLETVFEFTPVDNPLNYSAFCHVFGVSVPSTYVQGSLRDASAIAVSGYPLVDLHAFVNYPIITASSTPAPPPAQAPPADESYLAAYVNSQVLHEDTSVGEKVLLLWNYLEASLSLEVAIVGYNINGYVAVGFSSEETTMMTDADIVLGYLNSATLEGCVRVLYSAFATSAPSAAPTLQIRSQSIQRLGDALILSFVRDFDGGAHTAGRIPTPSILTGRANGRVLFATLRQFISAECSTQAFSSLYHGTSPHGSMVVDWAAASSTPAPTTPQPETVAPSTPAPPALLQQATVDAQPVYYRGVLEQMVCAPLPAPIATRQPMRSEETTSPLGFPLLPPMYYFMTNGSIRSDLLPLIEDFPMSSIRYSGAWRVHVVELGSLAVSSNITSSSAALSLLGSDSGVTSLEAVAVQTDRFLHCPVVHRLTTAPNTTLQTLYFDGQAVQCLLLRPVARWFDLGLTPEAMIAPMWNISNATGGTRSVVVDDIRSLFFSVVRGSTNRTLPTRAEEAAALSSDATTVVEVVHCAIVTPLNRTTANQTASHNDLLGTLRIEATTIPLATGVMSNRSVAFYAIASHPRGRCANKRSGWSTTVLGTMYIVRNTTVGGMDNLTESVLETADAFQPLRVLHVTSLNTTSFNSTTNVTTWKQSAFVDARRFLNVFVDALPGVHASYCDGVWNVVVVDVANLTSPSLLVNSSNSTNGTASDNANASVEEWESVDYIPSPNDRGWYMPWWSRVDVLRALPRAELGAGKKLHCPLINRSTTILGSSGASVSSDPLIQRLSALTVGGYLVDCLNLGWLDEAVSSMTIPTLINVTSVNPQSPAVSAVFEAIPGSRYFSTIHWVRELAGTTTIPHSIASTLLRPEQYHATYILVVSVGPVVAADGVHAPAALTTWNISSSTAVFTAAPTTVVARDAASGIGVVTPRVVDANATMRFPHMLIGSTSSAPPQRSTVYYFRRGSFMESSAATLRPVASHAPNETYFHRANGTWGYTDAKRVVVVTVPWLYVGPEPRRVSEIPSSWTQTEAALLSHLFVMARAMEPIMAPSTSGFAMWCPSTQVWIGGNLWSAVDCGFGPTETAAAPTLFSVDGLSKEGIPDSTALLRIGAASHFTVAPLALTNTFLKLVYSMVATTAFRLVDEDTTAPAASAAVQGIQFVRPLPHFGAISPQQQTMRKYVFRSGPALSSSNDVHPPIVAFGSGTASYPAVSELFVVNVGAHTPADEVAALYLRTESDVLEASLAHCWPIIPTHAAECGLVLHVQSNISTSDLWSLQRQRMPGHRLQVHSVYIDGVERIHVTSAMVVAWPSPSNGTTGTLFPTSAEALDGTLLLGPRATPTAFPLHQVRRVPQASFQTRQDVLSMQGEAVSAAMHNGSMPAEWVLVLVLQEDAAAYVAPPLPTALRRQAVWFQGRLGAAYVFDRSLRHPEQPAPLFVFRRLGSNGAVQSTISPSLIDALPGHASYNDLHLIMYCDVAYTATSAAFKSPLSVRAMQLMILQGVLLPPTSSGIVKMLPIVHASTTVELQDRLANGGSVLGPNSVVYEGAFVASYDFGIASNGFAPALSIATELVYAQNNLAVPDGLILHTSPTDNASVFSFVQSVQTAQVPTWVLPGTVQSDADVAQVAVHTATAVRNISVAVVAMAEVNGGTDDTNVSTTGPTPMVWSYGSVNFTASTGVVVLQPATRSGSGSIDFFDGTVSGSSKVTDDWLNITNVTASVKLGDAVELSWALGTLSATAATETTDTQHRAFQALSDLEIVTYAPSELYAQVKFVVTADVWVGFGISPSGGGMSDADMWIAYASLSVPAGAVASGSFYELSDRHANPTDPYSTPIKDLYNNLELLSLSLTSSGYEMVVRRKLLSDDSSDLPILNEMQTFIWAYGPYALQSQLPQVHTNRGVVLMNMFTGQNITVEQRTLSFWYIAMLVGYCLLVVLLGFTARLLPPGVLLYKRPLIHTFLPRGVRCMTVAELAVFIGLVGIGCGWGYGCWTDFDVSRRAHAVALSIGSAAQYCLYFAFVPTARHNVLLTGVFRSSWHKMQHWTTLLMFPALVLGWVHGVSMMVQSPDASFHTTKGVCSIIGLSLLTLLFFAFHSFTRWRAVVTKAISARRLHPLYLTLTWAIVALLSIHTPRLALGWIPWLIVFLVDHVLRWKDFSSRFGHVVAVGTFGPAIAAFEVRLRSPWNLWTTHLFTSSPGQFALLDIEGVAGGPVPLTITSRVLQDQQLDYASATFHLKSPPDSQHTVRSRICTLAQRGVLAGRAVRIEGPYGGIGMRLKWYRSLVLVGGGMGAGSCISLLEAMVFQPDYYAQNTSVENLTLVLVAKSTQELATFATELFEILQAPRPFDLQVFLHCTTRVGGASAAARPLAGRQAPTTLSEGNFHSIIDVMSPPRGGDAAQCVTSNPSEVHPLFEHVTIFHQRPNWANVIAAEQISAGKRSERRVAVHVNGPASMTMDVLETCENLNCFEGVQIHADYEVYDALV